MDGDTVDHFLIAAQDPELGQIFREASNIAKNNGPRRLAKLSLGFMAASSVTLSVLAAGSSYVRAPANVDANSSKSVSGYISKQAHALTSKYETSSQEIVDGAEEVAIAGAVAGFLVIPYLLLEAGIYTAQYKKAYGS